MARSVIIIQARMRSTRLPGKVLMDVAGQPLLFHVVQRSLEIGSDRVVVATSSHPADDAIAELCDRYAWPCFRGSEEDVLDRYYRAGVEHKAEHVLRVTADNPLICSEEARRALAQHIKSGADYTHSEGLPLGAAVEVISFKALERAWREARLAEEREHVTPYLCRSGLFKVGALPASPELRVPELRLTVDVAEDLELMRRIYARLYHSGKIIPLSEVVTLLRAEPGLTKLNAHVVQRAV
jgi:spore coat polysaccharide biosynthesis protein SpsF (cytidylyltransferase family)